MPPQLTVERNHSRVESWTHVGCDGPDTPISRCGSSRGEAHNHGGNFPCLNPHNATMQDIAARRSSFQYWRGHTAASISELVEAGLYYIGISDKTKCFYCDGGLENWEYNDDPMVEHAKWFPQCEYLLRKKGTQFVISVAEQFPNLPRPSVQNHHQEIHFGAGVVDFSNTVVFQTVGATSTITINGQPFDPAQFQQFVPEQSLGEKVARAMRGELVNNMREIGYGNDVIKRALQRRLTSSGMFDSLHAFLDAVEAENNLMGNHNSRPVIAAASPASPQGAGPSTSVASSAGDTERRIQEIQNEQRCKICLDQESSCVFHPCNHLCACLDCGGMLNSCPICRQPIARILRVYKS